MIKVSALTPEEMAVLYDRALPILAYGMVFGTTTEDSQPLSVPSVLLDDTAQPGVASIDARGDYYWYADLGTEHDTVLMDFQGQTVPKDETPPVALGFTARFDLPDGLETLLAIAQNGTVQFLGTSANDFTPEQLASPVAIPVSGSVMVFHELPVEGLQALLPLVALGIQMRGMRIEHEASENGVATAA